MGLWSAVKSAATGNFSDAGNLLFIPEDDITTQSEVNNAQQKIVERQYAEGLVDSKEAAELTQQMQLNAYPNLFKTEGSPLGEFNKSIGENLTSGVKWLSSGAGGIVGAIAKGIPLWIWGIILIAAAFYFMPIIRAGLFIAKRRG